MYTVHRTVQIICETLSLGSSLINMANYTVRNARSLSYWNPSLDKGGCSEIKANLPDHLPDFTVAIYALYNDTTRTIDHVVFQIAIVILTNISWLQCADLNKDLERKMSLQRLPGSKYRLKWCLYTSSCQSPSTNTYGFFSISVLQTTSLIKQGFITFLNNRLLWKSRIVEC